MGQEAVSSSGRPAPSSTSHSRAGWCVGGGRGGIGGIDPPPAVLGLLTVEEFSLDVGGSSLYA